jgi:hypothetical protein
MFVSEAREHLQSFNEPLLALENLPPAWTSSRRSSARRTCWGASLSLAEEIKVGWAT